ncbi:MAG: tRNA (adenosine(37)-N6)-threonylcarbamoyltransferase complex dimerization subunit type 1 TsaB [Flavobacteriaceae bacterium]|nr:tRNA (adenosine(37)-N6)-threonylcarbamoyltransferase complex dimerization subunit type 1 TsaB [Flavobacteriaceae bacterium]MDZ4146886.1 tRNA (adenosine(37)-N6)-threonylcarbamoyltransferase complex dimerization subunit type 1 TsaB [Flavobacteriaceae bacterium]
MSLILNLETATKNCSVSLSNSGKTIALTEEAGDGFLHGERLHNFIKQTLSQANVDFKDLNAVAVSKGPGSYTGLRIGVSAAKGICFALNIPLISTDTLFCLAKKTKIKSGFIVPVIDARRMEVYTATFDEIHQTIEKTSAKIIDEESFDNLLRQGKVYFTGDGADKCKSIITHPNAVFLDSLYPSADEMSAIAFQKFTDKNFENVAYFEPYYLKEFIGLKKKQ